jgi:ring-1,2-phenylacetyl-CoA epoxidase subunit PaaD
MLSTKFSEKEIYDLIAGIPDPEIPVITIEDLGILREVKIEDDKVKVFITPTYSGCPAMKAIENDIADILRKNEINSFEVKTVFAPVWTTDWISDEAKEKLRKYGISPPEKSSTDKNILLNKHVRCPQCNSENTVVISQFGSTACKALYKCQDCLEPFDHFKCH